MSGNSSTAINGKHMRDTQLSSLHKAIRCFRIEDVQRLLEDPRCPIDRNVIHDAAVTYYDNDIFRLIAISFIARRQKLLGAALVTLPRRETDNLLGPLDTQAASIALRLLEYPTVNRDIITASVPDLGSSHCDASVYFLVGCNREAAQILYDLGYKKVDEQHQMTYSPLAALKVPPTTGYHGQYRVVDDDDALAKYLAMCAWFQERGAFLYRKVGWPSRTTALHQIARCIGMGLARSWHTCSQIGSGEDQAARADRFKHHLKLAVRPLAANSRILQEILRDERHSEQYVCACSSHGQLPLHILINETIHGVQSPLTVCFLVATLLKTEDLLNTSAKFSPLRVSAVFRACSFACLKLEHTCQTTRLPKFSILQGEGRVTNAGLDSLVSTCESVFRTLNLPLRRFLENWWVPYMQNIQERGIFIPSFIERLPQITELVDGTMVDNKQLLN
ncbi:uncharacterized protein BDW70DRAFT_48264 [Aspergillus foveolatus]|uniref:uncharacterized protein n=1 Tax=Aspergillus foveolatus TaxID=210207 RepID=UPI003CCCDED4